MYAPAHIPIYILCLCKQTLCGHTQIHHVFVPDIIMGTAMFISRFLFPSSVYLQCVVLIYLLIFLSALGFLPPNGVALRRCCHVALAFVICVRWRWQRPTNPQRPWKGTIQHPVWRQNIRTMLLGAICQRKGEKRPNCIGSCSLAICWSLGRWIMIYNLGSSTCYR